MRPLRVALICGGLESGADGVGDYCRRLAEEMVKCGLQCLVIAFNDRSIDREIAIEGTSAAIKLVRLPEGLSIGARLARASSLLSDWRPDWVSFQFVCYAFSRKGLAFKELFWLPRLFRGCRLHVMLHELWIGLGSYASTKNTIVGVVQRSLILRLLHRLRPNVVDTNNHYYQTILASCGFETRVLPLFSNVPVKSDTAGTWLDEAVRYNGGPDLSNGREQYWLFGMFGGIAKDWPAGALFARLAYLAKRATRRAVVISAGHAGAHAAGLLERLRRQYPDIHVVTVGPRSPDQISQFLNSMDFGISSHPLYLLGKSGSTAAMLEHGLPVIVSWGDIVPECPVVGSPFDSLVWRNDSQLEERLKRPPERSRRPDWSAVVAQMLISRLSQASD